MKLKVLILVLATSSVFAAMEAKQTWIGTLEFKKGYPSDASVEMLYGMKEEVFDRIVDPSEKVKPYVAEE